MTVGRNAVEQIIGDKLDGTPGSENPWKQFPGFAVLRLDEISPWSRLRIWLPQRNGSSTLPLAPHQRAAVV